MIAIKIMPIAKRYSLAATLDPSSISETTLRASLVLVCGILLALLRYVVAILLSINIGWNQSAICGDMKISAILKSWITMNCIMPR